MKLRSPSLNYFLWPAFARIQFILLNTPAGKTRHSLAMQTPSNAADPTIMQCYLAPYNVIYLCTARNCCDSAIRQSCSSAATSQLWEVWISVLHRNQSGFLDLSCSYCLPFSKSPHRFMVILLLSNSPSYSIPAFFVFSPAVFRVSPQLKSSNFQ